MIYFDDIEIVSIPQYDSIITENEQDKPQDDNNIENKQNKDQRYKYQIKKSFKAKHDGDVYFFIDHNQRKG